MGRQPRNRMRFAVQTVGRYAEPMGPEFISDHRLSMLDLVEDGSSWERSSSWHGDRTGGRHDHQYRHRLAFKLCLPTIATSRCPCAGFSWVTAEADGQGQHPLITTNRINDPTVAEQVLADGCADMVSMARPFLADAAFVQKAAEGAADEINTIRFSSRPVSTRSLKALTSCLVNPRACREPNAADDGGETEKLAVVGAGPAGLAFATTAASRGHQVTLFDAAEQIGGQFNIAMTDPRHEEFHETLRYFRRQLERCAK